MSIRVKRRLDLLHLLTTHAERVDVDKEIERKTGLYCDKGIDQISDDELRRIVEAVRAKKKKVMEVYA